MDEIDTVINRVFAILFVLIVVVYFTGSTSVLKQMGVGAVSLINSLTGRDASGQFAGYPAGTTTG